MSYNIPAGVYIDWNELVEQHETMVKSKLSNNARSKPTRRIINITNTVRKQIPSKRKVGSMKRSNRINFDLNSAFNEISGTFTKALSNPLVLLTIALSVGMIYTHDFTKKTGYIYDTFKGDDVISKWIIGHGKKFCGMLTFLPAVVDSPKNMRALVALMSFLWIMIVPEINFAEYFLQSLALHTYFKLRTNNSKLVVISVVALAWFMGYFTPLKPQAA